MAARAGSALANAVTNAKAIIAATYVAGSTGVTPKIRLASARDGDPSASFVLYDTVSCQITYCRAPYDVATAAGRIRDNGLPHWLADRLSQGR